MGRHMERLLKFCINYPTWQTISKNDPAARRAVSRLVDKGLLERNEYGQVRIAIKQPWRESMERYRIINKTNPFLSWSNVEGWNLDIFDLFTTEEKNKLNLPIDGEWRAW